MPNLSKAQRAVLERAQAYGGIILSGPPTRTLRQCQDNGWLSYGASLNLSGPRLNLTLKGKVALGFCGDCTIPAECRKAGTCDFHGADLRPEDRPNAGLAARMKRYTMRPGIDGKFGFFIKDQSARIGDFTNAQEDAVIIGELWREAIRALEKKGAAR